ncbi:MAG: HAD-IA family hydrolase [Caldisericaceae bacterium]|nr:HAD-IA family hydrolase [Caldisericaceae bacterium]
MKREAIRCIIFDLDGTLFDAPYDWVKIKQALGVPEGEGILSYIEKLPDKTKEKKMHMLKAIEEEATRKGKLKNGVQELLNELKKRGIKKVLLTNNLLRNVRYIMRKYGIDFDMIITREMGMTKPGNAATLYILKEFGLNKDKVILVGDSDYDVQTANLSKISLIIVGEMPLKGNFIRVKDIAHLSKLLLNESN